MALFQPEVLSVAVYCALSLSLLAAGAADTNTPPAATAGEPPHWPIGLLLPDALMTGWKPSKKPAAHVLVWVPPQAQRIRAVLLVPQNTDSKHVAEHAPLRDVAARHEIGIVYLRHLDGSVVERTDPPAAAEPTLAAILDLVAEATGIVEFRHAPWITFGKSSRGRFPFRMAWWFPDRVVASISYHGETPTWPMEAWSRAGREPILHLAINGETEWEGTWYRHVRPCLLNYRAHTGWLPHQVVLPGVGHGNYVDTHGSPGWGAPVPDGRMSCLRVWDYIALFIDRAMTLRVPAGVYPTEAPIRLLAPDPGAGYLLHPRAPEELLGIPWHPIRRSEQSYTIIPWPEEKSPVLDPAPGTLDPALLLRPAHAVPEDEWADSLWLPDRALAEAWLRLHNLRHPSLPLP